MFHRAKKSLGQNFLKSILIINKIVETAKLQLGEQVLEIGPGKGAITNKLLAAGAQVTAVELDQALFEYLQKKFSDQIASKQLRLLNQDILTTDLAALYQSNEDYKIVANIPYNITGAIIRFFLEHPHQPTSMTLLVQKEVAERIVARDGKHSILSLSVHAFGEPRYIKTVRKTAFQPAPKVDSAILYIDHISRSNFTNSQHEQAFFEIVKHGFAHKRKTLVNNLSADSSTGAFVRNFLEQDSLLPTIRAEDLSLEQWLQLANHVHQHTHSSLESKKL
jgi:16S rRNA (adenine1518-N6/adenine1519-N6)-dimethyltransferase